MTNRSRIEIIIQILEVVNDLGEDGDGVTQTTIRYQVFLSSAQLKQYLTALTIHCLLSYESTTRRYNATEKGLRFLNNCYKMDDMINQLQHQQQQQQHQQPRHIQNSNKYG